ncbi:MAG: long-chain fatty acid--CoA ligase [Acidimicrobiales bacterium]|jgi:fatty-acyl-CoA synthase
MHSTMQDRPLLVRDIFSHGKRVHGSSEVVTFEGDSFRRASFAEVAARAERLASGLQRLGVSRGERVATFCLNHQEHLEAYFAVPAMGAVLHTLNVRLFSDQLAHVIDHAGDKVIIADAVLAPALARVLGDRPGVEHVITVGEGDVSALGETIPYEELIGPEAPGFDWPDLDETDAAAMCYTSGTTGSPKGVVYSHRSIYLHSLSATSSGVLGISGYDRILLIVPQFHVNAWGVPYAAWLAGADLIMPKRFLQGEALVRIIEAERPSFACAVPTIWTDVLRHAQEHGTDMSSFRAILVGGAPVPRSMIERFDELFSVPIVQGWGMTETSPLGAIALAPRGTPPEREIEYRSKTGRVCFGVEVRAVDAEGRVCPTDGVSVGEFEIRGPWVTGEYYEDPSPERFHDGWLRTGDVGTLDSEGFMQITDRTKDVIKTGGEWISSVELENLLMAHPEVVEAAVVAVHDARWGERPLACVVLAEGCSAGVDELTGWLRDKVPAWWVPEQWAFVAEIPKTSVGKFDKKVLRTGQSHGELAIVTLARGQH